MRKLHFQTALLPQGWARNVLISCDESGTIAAVETGAERARGEACSGAAVPGMPNLHCHAFQRGMAGLSEIGGPAADSFWTWRQVMYRFLDRLTPDDMEAIAELAYVEMLESGFTAVCEFHYLHNAPDGAPYDDLAEMSSRIAAAASATGIGLTLLPVLYGNGGFGGLPIEGQQRRFFHQPDRFARLFEQAGSHATSVPDATLGVAPHSLRAVTPDSLAAAIELAGERVIHMHVAEQPKEIADCLSWSGLRPMEWLLANAPLDQRWCTIHSTHLTPAETEALARSGAVAGLCPITEANLGDGIFHGRQFLNHGGRIGIGTDSQIRIDAAEELRTLEYSQRLRDIRRNVLAEEGFSTGRRLFADALRGGAQASSRKIGALAPGYRADIVTLDEDHPALIGRSEDRLLDSWIFVGGRECVRNVWVHGRQQVRDGRHIAREGVLSRYRTTIARILA